MKLIRTFHPVGFGAFYTEKHIDPTSKQSINVVYDCGTLHNKHYIKDAIRSYFKQGDYIDLLIISHFDIDHIKGIPFLMDYCNIKKVIIPYIPKEDRILFVYSQEELPRYAQLIIDTQKYFGPTTEVISIKSIEQENQSDNPDHKTKISEEKGEHDKSEESLISGSRIKLPSLSNWCFIPFNYDYSAQVATLKKILVAQGLDYDQLSSIKYIKSNYNSIHKAYKGLANTNETSLVCFSGTLSQANSARCVTLNHVFNPCNPSYMGLNCLYYGDANTSKIGFLCHLQNRLKGYYNSVQTIQIPHHGSDKNFNIHILQNPSNQISVISSAPHKKYNLPKPTVIKDIQSTGSIYINVTKDPKSKFIEEGYY